MLEAEMEDLLGKEKYEREEESSYKNYRNGYSKKNIKSSVGDVKLDIPRDIQSELEELGMYLDLCKSNPSTFPKIKL